MKIAFSYSTNFIGKRIYGNEKTLFLPKHETSAREDLLEGSQVKKIDQRNLATKSLSFISMRASALSKNPDFSVGRFSKIGIFGLNADTLIREVSGQSMNKENA